MNKGLWQSTTYSIPILTPEGTRLNAEATEKYKNPNKAKKLNARIHTMDFLQIMSEVAKSSKDILILKDVINEADVANEIKLVNITKFADRIGAGVTAVKGILSRACEHGLLYKIDTGHYMMNPYVLLSKGLTYATDDSQVVAQSRWTNYSTVFTESDRIAVNKLAHFVDAPALYTVPIIVSIANQYVSKGKVSDKQKAVVLKYICSVS